jgi:hypothetical protein
VFVRDEQWLDISGFPPVDNREVVDAFKEIGRSIREERGEWWSRIGRVAFAASLERLRSDRAISRQALLIKDEERVPRLPIPGANTSGGVLNPIILDDSDAVMNSGGYSSFG